ncbi:hypothetical protein LRS13_18290 [Svornostia abyssi]|uniref:Uncharacterized protein n=1 Tax=Svornostia abyssi TaxID=2898438 RepID=A0ABY5PD73_9ACTN|nr:hypothetical protein LRS13_18290 [Parviterribacteraceae bacterium J379]
MLRIRISIPAACALLIAAVGAAPADAAKDLSRYRTSGAATPAVAAPAATSARLYAGTTSYGLRPLVLEVRGGRVSRMVAQYGGECFSYAHDARGGEIRGATVSRAGRVRATVRTTVTNASSIFTNASSAAVRVDERLTATVGRRFISGSIQATVTFQDGSTCKSRSESFRIEHDSRRVYGGVTSQEYPVVFELEDDGSEVRHMHFGWAAECATGGWTVLSDYLVDFPLSGGAFGDVFTQEYPGQTLTWRYGYDIKGRVSRTGGSGRFQVDVAGVDAAGAVQEGCNTKVVTWSVRT